MDPIADMLTQIRNANQRTKDYADIPSSKIKQEIVKIMKDEGFIKGFRFIEDSKQNILRVYLKYANNNKVKAIKTIKKVSLSSRRVYVGSKEIPKIKSGLAVSILSTPKGVMTDKAAREANVGGEILCEIW